MITIGNNSTALAQYLISKLGVNRVSVLFHEVGKNWSQENLSRSERAKKFLSAYEYKNIPCSVFSYSSNDFLRLSTSQLEKKAHSYDPPRVASLCSRVMIDDNPKHLPMMNFHPGPAVSSSDVLELVKFLSGNQRGWLLNSGRYLHYYGMYLQTDEEWRRWIGDFLIPFEFVHPGYAGYRLQDGYSTLRLTKLPPHKPKVPCVVEVIHE